MGGLEPAIEYLAVEELPIGTQVVVQKVSKFILALIVVNHLLHSHRSWQLILMKNYLP